MRRVVWHGRPEGRRAERWVGESWSVSRSLVEARSLVSAAGGGGGVNEVDGEAGRERLWSS